MPLEHDPTPRFTVKQQDEILDLAARLQTQHEATVGADELMRAAQEAGLDPRFVQEAAMRLGQKSGSLPRSLLVGLGLFTLQAFFFVFIQNIGLGGGRSVSAMEVGPAIVFGFLLALWAARERVVRWYVPLASLGVWFALFVGVSVWTSILGTGQHWVLQTAIVFGLAQTMASLFGSTVAAGLDRLDGASRELPSPLRRRAGRG